MGSKSAPLSIERVLDALGVECIEFANPHHLDESIDAVTKAVSFEGPSAVIFRAPCVNLVKPEAPVSINAETCTGCKKCITSIGCPGIGFDEGLRGPKSGGRGQASSDTSLCDGCGLCTQVCSFNAIQGAVGFGGAVPAEPAIYAPNPDPFQTGRSLVY